MSGNLVHWLLKKAEEALQISSLDRIEVLALDGLEDESSVSPPVALIDQQRVNSLLPAHHVDNVRTCIATKEVSDALAFLLDGASYFLELDLKLLLGLLHPCRQLEHAHVTTVLRSRINGCELVDALICRRTAGPQGHEGFVADSARVRLYLPRVVLLFEISEIHEA